MKKPFKQLKAFFDPHSVAVVGATKKVNKAGYVILKNFVETKKRGVFKGNIFPVNPHEEYILGLRCYSSVKDIPENLELVIVVVPAQVVPQIMEESAQKKSKPLS